jgi:hypothetical protein
MQDDCIHLSKPTKLYTTVNFTMCKFKNINHNMGKDKMVIQIVTYELNYITNENKHT